MNELSLFSGAGGGVLGSILLGHRIIGYVENNEYCQKVIAQRIKDGILDPAPIFSNIQAFNRAGFAEQYQGLVDVVSGGFPCQDISCAGKGEGITGSRSGLWFEMRDTIRLVRPRYVFIENSSMLFIRGFEHIICGLSKMGFDVAWGIVSAADVGAPHLRKGLWILAKSECARTGDKSKQACVQGRITAEAKSTPLRQRNRAACAGGVDSNGSPLANTEKQPIRAGLCKDETPEIWRRRSGNGSCENANSDQFNDDHCGHGASQVCRKRGEAPELSRCETEVSNPSERTDKQRISQPVVRTLPGENERDNRWWRSEPTMGRVANGVAHRVDRLRAIGNGQVPLVAATAFRILQSKLRLKGL